MRELGLGADFMRLKKEPIRQQQGLAVDSGSEKSDDSLNTQQMDAQARRTALEKRLKEERRIENDKMRYDMLWPIDELTNLVNSTKRVLVKVT